VKTRTEMKNTRTFLMSFVAVSLLVSCGAGTESTGAVSNESSQTPCVCLSEMNASLAILLSNEQAKKRNVQEWTQALADNTSPCMLVKRTPEELSAWSKAQSECPEFQAYTDWVNLFRGQLSEARESSRNMPQSMNELSGGGAKDLLDQLSKGNQ
jgi:hypothetical protein